MKWKRFVLVIFIVIPVLVFAMRQTYESARRYSHVVFEGKVLALGRHKATFETNVINLTTASIHVTNVIKGSLASNQVATVYYEAQPEYAERCPPYVTLQVGDIGVFAAVTNLKERFGLDLFMGSADFVEIRTNALTNANK